MRTVGVCFACWRHALFLRMTARALRILAVGAHPDDIEFAVGGILLAEAARGSEIFLCVCSRGEAGTNGTPDQREAEARAAAKMVGAEIVFLDFGGDSHLEPSNANGLALARHIRVVAARHSPQLRNVAGSTSGPRCDWPALSKRGALRALWRHRGTE